jgi:hypothetical protein
LWPVPGAAVSALANAPGWLRLVVPLIAVLVSFWLLQSNYGSLALDASNLHEGWNAVHARYERLWNDLDSPDAQARFDEIFESANPLSKSGTKFPNDKKRLEYWLAHAAQMATARYA